MRCKRVEKLFCKNERAVLRDRGSTASGHLVTLVPVAAILVASIRLHFLDVLLHLRYRGPNVIACDAPLRARARRWAGSSMGSTIIVFAPEGFALCDGVHPRAERSAWASRCCACPDAHRDAFQSAAAPGPRTRRGCRGGERPVTTSSVRSGTRWARNTS